MDDLSTKIQENPLFLKLKTVIENNPYHDNQDVYSHSIKTYETAKKLITGDFIENSEEKELFLEFINEDYEGAKRHDLMLITSLIHDIGKILYYKEDGKEKSIRHVSTEGKTRLPGHEYWGSTIVPELLKDSGLSEKAIERIADVVRLHDSFNEGYFKQASDWDLENLIDDIKSRAEGLYKEALFNILCDCYYAPVYDFAKKRIIEVFNCPSIYTQREYFIK